MAAKPKYDVVVPVGDADPDPEAPQGEGKTYWHKIGAAWEKGDRINIQLNSLPFGRNLYLFPRKDEK